MSNPRRMHIGDLARHIGASPRALRHYEQQGLLAPSREDNGYRVYDEIEVVRAANIKDLLDVGLTTADIQRYLDGGCLDYPLSETLRCSGELETAQHRLGSLDQMITRLQRTRDRLAAHSRALETTLTRKK